MGLGFFQGLINNTGLNFTILYGGVSKLPFYLLSLLDAGRDFIFHWSVPDPIIGWLSAEQIAFPPYNSECDRRRTTFPYTNGNSCGYPITPLKKMMRHDKLVIDADFNRFFESLLFSDSAVNAMLKDHVQGGGTKNTYNVSCDWIKDNMNVWKDWAKNTRIETKSTGIETQSSVDIGIIVGPIVGGIVIVAGIVMYFQRYQLQRRTRDVTHAPKEKVAIAFTDVQNSTALWKEYPDAMRKAMEMHHATIRKVMSKHHGYEVKTIGDSFMIATGSADAAVLLTNEIHTTLLAAEWPSEILDSPDACVNFQDKALVFKGLRVRVGIDIGNPEVVYDEVSKGFDYYGDVSNCAARVESIAYGGQTLITGRVLGEMSEKSKAECNMVDVGKVALKGILEKVHVYQVMPKHLVRHFAVPKQDSSAAASEHSISGGLRSPRGLGNAAKPIEEMTMVQIMHELSRVRATAAAAEDLKEDPLNSPSNAVVPGINPLGAVGVVDAVGVDI